MTARELNKTKLSKGILDMKFMKRTKDKVLQEAEDEEGRNMYSNEITDKMRHGGSKYISESSYILCEDLIVGRVSFRGMNPVLEKILDDEEAARNQIHDLRKETVVSDKEMAHHYNSLAGNISNRFDKSKRFDKKKKFDSKNIKIDNRKRHDNGKNNSNSEFKNKRAKFIKPNDS